MFGKNPTTSPREIAWVDQVFLNGVKIIEIVGGPNAVREMYRYRVLEHVNKEGNIIRDADPIDDRFSWPEIQRLERDGVLYEDRNRYFSVDAKVREELEPYRLLLKTGTQRRLARVKRDFWPWSERIAIVGAFLTGIATLVVVVLTR